MPAIGPAYLGLQTDMEDKSTGVIISDLESISVDPGTQTAGHTNAFTGDAMLSDSVFALPPNVSVTAELYDTEIETLAMLIFGSVKFEGSTTGALGFGKEGIQKIDPANLPTLYIIPSFEAGDGLNAAHGIWLPKVASESLASIVYNRLTAGSGGNSYTVTFRAAQAKKIAATSGDVAVPSGCEFGWIGNPEEAGFDLSTNAWEIPTLG